MSEPAVSLIFSTISRARQLPDLLGHIARLNSSSAWELVIADNGSTDGTNRILSDFSLKANFPVKVLYEPKPGKCRGLNKAIAASTGDIVAFIDDDCYVAPDHIDRVLEVFSDPKIGFAGGRVELFDPTDHPISTRTSSQPELYPPYSYIEGGLILGGNMMFRRRVLSVIGGFDTDFGPGTSLPAAEDTEIQSRASFAGWWGIYTPDVVVAHHHGRKSREASALMRKYCNADGACKLKFLLLRESRTHFFRAWYWYLLGVMAGRYPIKSLVWELEGAARYGAIRIRRQVSSFRQSGESTTESIPHSPTATSDNDKGRRQQSGITRRASGE
jgi:glycosyltransferase involved in cell wall biosynthesis